MSSNRTFLSQNSIDFETFGIFCRKNRRKRLTNTPATASVGEPAGPCTLDPEGDGVMTGLPVEGVGLSHLEEGVGEGDDMGSQDICHHYDHDEDCVVVEDEDMEEAILGEFECIPLQV